MASATVYSSTADAFVRSNAGTWSLARSGTNLSAVTADARQRSAWAHANLGDFLIYVGRGFLGPFDLSALSGVTVTAVDLQVYAYTVNSAAGGSVGVVSSTAANPVTTSDWGNVGSTDYATRVNFSSFTAGQYNTLSFNATGIAAVQAALGSTFKCALRSSFDIDNSAPSYTSVESAVYISYADQTGTSEDPCLVVTYTAPGGGVPASPSRRIRGLYTR